MEVRFEKICCPGCAHPMAKGLTVQGYNHPLVWTSEKNGLSYADAVKLTWLN